MCVQNLKSVDLPVPEIIRGTQKIWAVLDSLDMPTLLFLQKILMGSDASYASPATFEVHSLLALPVPDLIGGGRGVSH